MSALCVQQVSEAMRECLETVDSPWFPLDPARAVRRNWKRFMPSPEVYYLHIHGEQLGPYTIPQIDHLLNTGLIAEETLYWREGLEQWAPVTSLVVKRTRVRPWGKIIAAALIVAGLGFLGAFFGPVIVDGWRETDQHEYTAEAAYWRARDAVRSHFLPKGAVVKFWRFSEQGVKMLQPMDAEVSLKGEVMESSGKMRPKEWRVVMRFDDQKSEWSMMPDRGSLSP
jgi:hypothetical protein